MGVGQLSESDAVDALRLPFYSSSHPTGSHGWRNQFDLGNPDCYHPLFLFNQFGDCEGATLRSGNVSSADGWQELLEPVVKRYQCNLPLSVCVSRRVWPGVCCKQNGFADKMRTTRNGR